MKPCSRNHWIESFWRRFTAIAVVAFLALGWASEVRAQGHLVTLTILENFSVGLTDLVGDDSGSRFEGIGEVVGPLFGAEPPTVFNTPLAPQLTGSQVAPLAGTVQAFIGFDANTGAIKTIRFLEGGTNIIFKNAVDGDPLSPVTLTNLLPGPYQARNTDQFGGFGDQGKDEISFTADDLWGVDGMPGGGDDLAAPGEPANHSGASLNTSVFALFNNTGDLDADQVQDDGPDGLHSDDKTHIDPDAHVATLNPLTVNADDDFMAQKGIIGELDPNNPALTVGLAPGEANMAWNLLGNIVRTNFTDVTLGIKGDSAADGDTATSGSNFSNVGGGGAFAGTSLLEFTSGFNNIYSPALDTDSHTPTGEQFAAFEFDNTLVQPFPLGTDPSTDSNLQQFPLRSTYPAGIPWRTFLGWDSDADQVADGAANTATDPLLFDETPGGLRPFNAGFPQFNLGITSAYETDDFEAEGVDALDNPGAFLAPITSGLPVPTDGLGSHGTGLDGLVDLINPGAAVNADNAPQGPSAGDLSFDIEVIDIGFDGIKGTADDVNLTGGPVTVTIDDFDLKDNGFEITGGGVQIVATAAQAANNLENDFEAALNAAMGGQFLRDIHDLFGPDGLHSDPGLHGGGHAADPGGLNADDIDVPDIVDADDVDVHDDLGDIEIWHIALNSNAVAFGIDITVTNVDTDLTTLLAFDTGSVFDPNFGDIDLQTGTNTFTYIGTGQPKIELQPGVSEPRRTLQGEIKNGSAGGSSIVDSDANGGNADLELTLDWDSTIGVVLGTFFFVGFTFDGEIQAELLGEYTPFPGDASPQGSPAGDIGVGTADYTSWANNFSSITGIGDGISTFTTYLTGDWNGDGITNAADYTIWANNFGLSGLPPGPVASGPASVPEPSSLVLLGLGGLGLVLAWRRRNRRPVA